MRNPVVSGDESLGARTASPIATNTTNTQRGFDVICWPAEFGLSSKVARLHKYDCLNPGWTQFWVEEGFLWLYNFTLVHILCF